MSSIPRLQGNRDSGRRLASYLFLAGWTFLSDSERIALLMYGLSVFVYASGFQGDKLIADHTGDGVVVHSCRLQNGKGAIRETISVHAFYRKSDKAFVSYRTVLL